LISKGLIIRPLQTILLIAALHDINLFALWIPSEENIVADAASRHDYEKLFNLSLQATRQPVNTSNLRRKLLLRNSFAPSTRQIYENLEAITPHFVKKKQNHGYTPLSLVASNPLQLGLLTLCTLQNQQQQRAISMQFDSIILQTASPLQYSTIPLSNLLPKEESAFMTKESSGYASHLPALFSLEFLTSSMITRIRKCYSRDLCGIYRLFMIWRIYVEFTLN